ncbi:T9SS type A sorting domain-containing protein [Rufibacter roseolus]|uniref:T9SS type A sorting domain-containing protein n=1 Tax=Rufibacter roseolus TaxID=2817375 RepID=UPI001B311958|nr:T9SS type A sorting domain-containing protein [Rufibacter roseolus]
MKTRLVRFFFLFFLPFSSLAQTQQCWECSIPGIALYDFDVQVPKPTDPAALTAWRKLFLAAGHVNNILSTTLSDNPCFTVFHADDLERDSPDPDHINLPGTRDQSYADYLVIGTVTGSGNDYTVQIKVVGAVNRKVAVTSSASFKLSDPDGPRDAAVRAANQLNPLLDKIKAFEQAEREASTDVALLSMMIGQVQPVDIKITPSKTILSKNEEIDVEIEMVDCDGYKLKNRKVRFTSGEVAGLSVPGTTCGQIIPSEVTTDEQGKAKVKYKAGNQACSGKIVAYYGFTHPNGSPGIMYGEVPINVENTDTWYVDVHYHYRMKRSLDKTSQTSEGTKYDKGSSNYETEYRAQFLYRPKEPMTDNISISSLAEPEAEGQVFDFFEQGSHTSFGNSYMKMVYKGGPVVTDRNRHLATGKPTDRRLAAINFDYGRFGDMLSLALDFEVDRTSTQSGGLGNGTNTSKDVESVGQVTVFDGINGGKIEVLPPTSTSRFKMYKVTFHEEKTNSSSGSRITWSETVRAYIMSPTIVTGILDNLETKDSGLELEQNFPNPFKGSTIIPYTLPARAQVSLTLYDVAGRPMRELVHETKPAGFHRVELSSLDLKPGMYFYKLRVGNQVVTKRMIHL